MEFKYNYAAVGAFVILLSIAAVMVGLWLSSGLTRQHYETYLVDMEESVSGLSEKASVKYNGVEVGYVKSIELNEKDPQEVRILVNVAKGTPITQSTRAILNVQGLTGIAFIDLKPGKIGEPLLTAKPGEKYPEIKTLPSLFFRLDQSLKDMTKSFTKIATSLNGVLSEKNAKHFTEILSDVKQVSDVMAKNSDNLNKDMKYLTTLLANASKASKSFPDTMINIRQAASAVAGFANNLSESSFQFNISLQHINELTDNLRVLSNEMRQDPSIIIRGKTAATTGGPGE